jgi:hypothetical protein
MIALISWILFTIMLYRCAISGITIVRQIGVPVAFAGMMVSMALTFKSLVLWL